MTFNADCLEDLLVCPNSRSKLVRDEESFVCVDPDCRLMFAIRDGIPVMLVGEATELSKDAWSTLLQRVGNRE
jgi:uncharacterized protein YbaR (Trm112 family)